MAWCIIVSRSLTVAAESAIIAPPTLPTTAPTEASEIPRMGRRRRHRGSLHPPPDAESPTRAPVLAPSKAPSLEPFDGICTATCGTCCAVVTAIIPSCALSSSTCWGVICCGTRRVAQPPVDRSIKDRTMTIVLRTQGSFDISGSLWSYHDGLDWFRRFHPFSRAYIYVDCGDFPLGDPSLNRRNFRRIMQDGWIARNPSFLLNYSRPLKTRSRISRSCRSARRPRGSRRRCGDRRSCPSEWTTG